jgi:hypothetical protein
MAKADGRWAASGKGQITRNRHQRQITNYKKQKNDIKWQIDHPARSFATLQDDNQTKV